MSESSNRNVLNVTSILIIRACSKITVGQQGEEQRGLTAGRKVREGGDGVRRGSLLRGYGDAVARSSARTVTRWLPPLAGMATRWQAPSSAVTVTWWLPPLQGWRRGDGLPPLR
jgi:hypothetical protein